MKLTRLPFSPGCPPSFVLIDLEFEESEDVDQSNIPWRPAHAVLLSRIFAANTHRLRTFEISSNIWQPIEGLASSLIDVPMPFLQSWTVMREKAQWGREFSSDLQSDAVTRAIECAPGATPSAELSDKMYPNLRVLTLQGTYQRWAQLIPRHLVELNLKHLPRNRRPTFNQLKVFLLGNQSTLESLTVWAPDPLRLRADQGNITLPKLKTLSLGFDSKSVSAERSLMTYLVLPRLLNLEIYDLADYNPSNITDDADEDILSMLSWLGLDDCYWHMIEYLPLNQITKLILRSSYHELSASDRFDEACLRQRGDSVPEVPILLKFLSNCSSLKELHLIDPNEASLRALVTAYPENHNNSSGLFLVCSSLDLLRIEIPRKIFPSKLDYRSLTDRKHDIVAPRRIETVELLFYQREDEGLWPVLSELNRARKTVFVNEHEPF